MHTQFAHACVLICRLHCFWSLDTTGRSLDQRDAHLLKLILSIRATECTFQQHKNHKNNCLKTLNGNQTKVSANEDFKQTGSLKIKSCVDLIFYYPTATDTFSLLPWGLILDCHLQEWQQFSWKAKLLHQILNFILPSQFRKNCDFQHQMVQLFCGPRIFELTQWTSGQEQGSALQLRLYAKQWNKIWQKWKDTLVSSAVVCGAKNDH